MFRPLVIVLALSCLAAPVWAQTPPAQVPPTASTIKSAVKKPAPKAKAAAKPRATDSGPCRIGVIAATGDVFAVQKIGLTVFGNELAEVPVTWGLDDLIFARVRAAAGASPVRRIAYAKGTFDAYYHPQPSLFRNERDKLATLVRQLAGNASCDRYLVVIRLEGQFGGTNQTMSGIGVLNRGTSLFSRSYLFAFIGIIVFDGRTFEIRKDPYANLESVMARFAANLTKDENLHELDNSAFPASPPEAANSTTLRDGTRDLLAAPLDKILPGYFKELAQQSG
jgi:hypothetical protein